MRTIEDVIPVQIPAGARTATVSKRLNPGQIMGVAVYKSVSGNNNPGMVRASIKDASGEDISKLQHIDNYRSRDCDYANSGKPLELSGGQNVTIDIVAQNAFTGPLDLDFIFMYIAE